jgi:hypothetical protein
MDLIKKIESFFPNSKISDFLLIIFGIFYMISGFTFLGLFGRDDCIIKVNDIDILKTLAWILTCTGIFMILLGILFFWKIKIDSFIYSFLRKGGWLGISILLLVPSIILYKNIKLETCDDINDTIGITHDSLNTLSLTIMIISIILCFLSCITTYYYSTETTEEKFNKLKENMLVLKTLSIDDLEKMFDTYKMFEEDENYNSQLPSIKDLENAIIDKYSDKISSKIFESLKSNYKKNDENIEEFVTDAYKKICEFNKDDYITIIKKDVNFNITPEAIIKKINNLNSKKEIDPNDLQFFSNLCKKSLNNSIKELKTKKISDIILYNYNRRKDEVLNKYCDDSEFKNVDIIKNKCEEKKIQGELQKSEDTRKLELLRVKAEKKVKDEDEEKYPPKLEYDTPTRKKNDKNISHDSILVYDS